MHKYILLSALSMLVSISSAQTKFLEAFGSSDYVSFRDSVQKNLVYPDDAQKKGISGVVHVQFLLDEFYRIIPETVRVVSGLSSSCDAEALRFVKSYKGTFRLSVQNAPDRTQPWVIPINFSIRGTKPYDKEARHTLAKPFKAIVVSKGISKVNPNWSIYPTAIMDRPKKTVSPGDTVLVTGWSAGTFYIKNEYTSGFISYKALEHSPEIDSLAEVIERQPPEEEEEPKSNFSLDVTGYDTTKIFKTESALFSITPDKTSLYVGECATVTMAFHVYTTNRLPIQFFDLGLQVRELERNVSATNAFTMFELIGEVTGVQASDSKGEFTKYPISYTTFCPAKSGVVVVPSQKLKMLVSKDLTKVKDATVVSFASSPVTLNVKPYPEGVSVTTFNAYKMTGKFEMKETVSADSIRAGQKFEYTVEIRSNSPTFPIEPPRLAIAGMKIQLVEISDERDENKKGSTSRKFHYQCIGEKEGIYDFTNKISFRYFNPVTAKTGVLRSSKKILVKGIKKTPDKLTPQDPFFSKSLLIAIDVSQSMMIEDYQPTRLEAVKQALKMFADQYDMCKVGILFFGANVKHLESAKSCFSVSAIDELSHDDVISGTAIADAIWVASVSAKAGTPAKIVIIGDGDNTAGNLTPAYAARFAKSKGVKVYSIGVGHKGEVVFGRDYFGRPNLISDTFNDNDFKMISRVTGGQYLWAQDTDAIVTALKTIFMAQ